MTYANIPGIAAALALFAVSYYTLRLNRFIGTPRLGGALCGGLSLLAILSLLAAASMFGPAMSGLAAGIFQALASVAIAMGMAHVEKMLSEHVRARNVEEEARKTEEEKRTEATSLLRKKIAELTKANDQWPKTHTELQQSADTFQAEAVKFQAESAAFQAEATEQKRIAEELAAANKKMTLSHEEELRRSSAALQSKVTELERSRAEMERMCSDQVKLRAEQERSQTQQVQLRAEVERSQTQQMQLRAEIERAQTQQLQLRAEMEKICKQLADALTASAAAKANTTVLQNIRKLLHDATASVDNVVGHVAKIRSANTSHITKLLRPTMTKQSGRAQANGIGKRLPGSVTVLSRQLTREQSVLVEQIASLKKKIERIQKIATAEPGTANGAHILQCAETDTATAIEQGHSHDTARCTREEVDGTDHPVLN